MKMTIHEQRFAAIEAAARALAEQLANCLGNAIASRGHATLAVSGGRTPQLVFAHLRNLPVAWQHVTITLTDERWVSVEDQDSTERLVFEHLYLGPVRAATFIPLYGGEGSPEAGYDACEARLQKLALPFDAVYLGMGDDGHFASLFPGDPAVEVRNGRCVAVPETGSRLARMSLTAPVLLDARRIFLLFGGVEKHKMYAAAKAAGSPLELPLRLVLRQQHTPVTVLMAP